MTNRTEIQAGMADYIRLVGNKPEVYTPAMCSEDLMEFLHSQDVVIKVDRELPGPDFENSHIGVEQFNHQLDIRKKMVEAGYVAVESLIETP